MDDLIKLVLGILFIGLLACIPALLIMVLWNWLMPQLFGLEEIGFWVAFGISWLASLIFKRSSGN